MKVFISVDMEGCAGVIDWEHAMRESMDYGMGRELMTGEANAAVQGALDAGAREVVVGDSHGAMFNLLPEKMHPEARMVQGRNKPISMLHGISKEFDALCLVGYHAMAGTEGGTLAHTYSGAIRECRINGKPFGEIALNAALAAVHGVPLRFVSGDEAACREARSLVPTLTTVAVKKGYGWRVHKSLSPAKARTLIQEGVKKALQAPPPAKTNLPKPPYTLSIDLDRPWMADICINIPGVKRTGGRTVEFKDKDYHTVYGVFITIMRLCSN